MYGNNKIVVGALQSKVQALENDYKQLFDYIEQLTDHATNLDSELCKAETTKENQEKAMAILVQKNKCIIDYITILYEDKELTGEQLRSAKEKISAINAEIDEATQIVDNINKSEMLTHTDESQNTSALIQHDNPSLKENIAVIIADEDRFLHQKEVIDFLVKKDVQIGDDLEKFAIRVSKELSRLKEESKLVNFKLRNYSKGTFWGVSRWLKDATKPADEDNIQSDHMFSPAFVKKPIVI